MKKYAEVIEGAISNIGAFKDNAEIPDGWIDVTGVTGVNKNDPVVNGIPVSRPSELHVLIDGEWLIPAEAQEQADNNQIENERNLSIQAEKESTGLKNVTIEQAFTYIDNQLDGATTIPQIREATKTILKRMMPFIL